LKLNSFDGSSRQDHVPLRWTGGDHSVALSEYLRDGRITHRDGLGELRVTYDIKSASTLIVDPFAQKVFAVEASAGDGEVFLAPIKGNTAVLKTGPGSLTLSGSNSHYAGTTVEGGRLVAGDSQAFGWGNVVVNGGTLDLASLPVSNDLSMVSGTLLNASQFVGSMDVSGVVVVSGTVGGSIFVDQQSELRGHDTTFAGSAVLAGVTSLTGSTSVEDGTLRIAHPLALAACSLVPLAGSTVDLSPDLHTIVGGLAPNAGGSIDVGNGMMTVAVGLTQSELLTAITSGMGDGSWNGTSGITSSAFVHSLNARTIGWLDNGDGSLTFGYAASGDANLDWQIDIIDIANVLGGGKVNSGLSATWAEGDFNYDGFADILDIADFMSSGLFNAGSYNAATEAIAAVPEPSTCAMALAGLACGGYSLFRRRKRA
jgi:autotransporter-associated beta strand protein